MINLNECKPLDFNKRHSKTMNRSICVPSAVQSYSLCIEYIKYWFLTKFPPDFFKSVYLDGKQILDEHRKLTKLEMIKRQKPALAIVPSINWDFDNEKVDFYGFGTDLYSPVSLFKKSFFTDPENSVYLGIGMETNLYSFNFRMKYETRAQQMDIYKYMKLALRVGSTNTQDVDLDFHVPYDLMLQIAHDTGFEICYEEVKQPRILNIRKFLSYLNSHSPLPFLYKFRAINGKHEFFIRMQGLPVHIRSLELTADDGEREGHIMNNFMVEWNVEVRFPSPKFYAYYSDNSHKLQTLYGAWYQPDGAVSSFYIFKGMELPDVNKYGWLKYLYTTYEEDIDNVGNCIEIPIGELMEGDIGEVIKDCLCNMISPAIFIQPVLVNNAREIDLEVDWETLTMKTKTPIDVPGSFIAFYVNMEYMNTALVSKREMDKDRITLDGTRDPKRIAAIPK